MAGTDGRKSDERERAARPAPSSGRAGPSPAPPSAAGPVAVARALQRQVGNRAAGRVLARWAKHPDAEKKGVMVPDSAAAEYDHFNPPQNA